MRVPGRRASVAVALSALVPAVHEGLEFGGAVVAEARCASRWVAVVVMRLVRLIAGALLVLVFLIVPPLAALPWIRTWRSPSAMQVGAWLAEPLTGATLVMIAVVLAASVWLVTSIMLVRRVVHRAGPYLRRLRVPTPMQMTAGSLAGMAVISAPSAVVAQADTSAASNGTADSSSARDPGERQPLRLTAGATLPDGGWLPPETVQAVTIAAAAGWLRRRRDYRPGSTSAGRDEVQDLPQTVAVIQDQTPAAPGDDLRPVPAVVGLRGAAPMPLDSLPNTGVGLSGPGATHAARGVLITALLSPATATVVTTRQDITQLLGDATPTLAGLPGVHVAGNFQSALDRLDPLNNVRTAGRTVLVATVPQRTSDAARLCTALSAPDTTAVLLGAWPHGANRRINTDGTTTSDSDAERWCVLGMQAAADLCTLAAHAGGSPSAQSPQTPARVTTYASTATAQPRATVVELALTVLGPPALTVRGTSVRLRRSAAMQALVLLAVHRDGVTARQVGTALWPAEGPHATSSRVYTTMSELRHTLTIHTGGPVVIRDDDRYRLDPDHIGVDLWDLEAVVTASITPKLGGGDHTTACWRVVDEYTGELAAGQTWPWLESHRERLRHHVLDTCIGLAEHAAPADRPAILQRAFDVDNCSEDVLRRLMTILSQDSDHGRIAELAAAHRTRLAVRGLTPSADFDVFVANLLAR